MGDEPCKHSWDFDEFAYCSKCGVLMACEEQIAALEAANRELRAAVLWALGEERDDKGNYFFPRGEREPVYHWRKNLRRLYEAAIAKREG